MELKLSDDTIFAGQIKHQPGHPSGLDYSASVGLSSPDRKGIYSGQRCKTPQEALEWLKSKMEIAPGGDVQAAIE